MAINYQEAREIALSKINESPGDDNPPKIMEELTKEYPWGWLFHYNSQDFLDNNRIEKAYIGNAPLFVDRIDGNSVFMWKAMTTQEELILQYAKSRGYIDEGE